MRSGGARRTFVFKGCMAYSLLSPFVCGGGVVGGAGEGARVEGDIL